MHNGVLKFPSAVNQMPARKVGSIADYDPLNDNYGSIAGGYRGTDHHAAYYGGRACSSIR